MEPHEYRNAMSEIYLVEFKLTHRVEGSGEFTASEIYLVEFKHLITHIGRTIAISPKSTLWNLNWGIR